MSRKTTPKQPDRRRERGVAAAVKKNGQTYYRASLTYRQKHISLGGYPTSLEAGAAYREGRAILEDSRFVLKGYTPASPLPFEKWVCLINFRDNGIYFHTPIYMGAKLFYYYLSPALALKFDPDDLFYYASHKIMRRGGHYFVADYGMQVSIVTRYGIKPYAREGRDFRFRNGDSTDFRRENLEILNVYHGVSLEQKKGRYVYTVRIHVKGYYLVGRYNDLIKAAVAYNKAIDVLRKNGVKKRYTPNYIEGLSPSRYAQIYAALAISPRLCRFRPAAKGEDHFSE